MTIIADSGSTKTHWASLNQGQTKEMTTLGLNPRLTSDECYAEVCSEVVTTFGQLSAADKVLFYGAGCGTEQVISRVKHILQTHFHTDKVQVAGDMLGACRAICGNKPGLVGILGTGSNTCYYDGTSIVQQRVSTGFVLGDEGSGNHIGRRLLKDYLEERMPERIRVMFHDDYPWPVDYFIDQLYRHPNPNRFLAQFAAFAAEHSVDEYVAEVLDDCFGAYFDNFDYFGTHAHKRLYLVGGITASFADSLARAAHKKGVALGATMSDPMAGLLKYHSDDEFFKDK